jgi:hypothetical protein
MYICCWRPALSAMSDCTLSERLSFLSLSMFSFFLAPPLSSDSTTHTARTHTKKTFFFPPALTRLRFLFHRPTAASLRAAATSKGETGSFLGAVPRRLRRASDRAPPRVERVLQRCRTTAGRAPFSFVCRMLRRAKKKRLLAD